MLPNKCEKKKWAFSPELALYFESQPVVNYNGSSSEFIVSISLKVKIKWMTMILVELFFIQKSV